MSEIRVAKMNLVDLEEVLKKLEAKESGWETDYIAMKDGVEVKNFSHNTRGFISLVIDGEKVLVVIEEAELMPN